MTKNGLIGLAIALTVFQGNAIFAGSRRAAQQPASIGNQAESKHQAGIDTNESRNRAEALKKYLEAQQLEQQNNYSAAVDAYKAAVALDPQSAELKIALGSLYLKNRNFVDAEDQARQALKLAASSVDARKLLAAVYVEQTEVGQSVDKDKARAAIEQLQEVSKLTPAAKIQIYDQQIPALALIGEIYLKLGENDKATESFEKLTRSDSTSDIAFFQLGRLYFENAKYREAADSARRAYDIAQKPDYADLLAQSLLQIGRTQDALDLYRKALGLKDKTAEKGDKQDKDDSDESDDDSEHPPSMSMGLLFHYAEALVQAGKYDEAKKVLDPVLKGAPKDSEPYLRAVRISTDALRRSGKRDEAIKTLQAALAGQDVTASLDLLFSLGETYGEMQQFDKAIQTYEEALKSILNPDGSINNQPQDKQAVTVIMTRIALAYKDEGKSDQTLATFERMKKILGPDDPQADELIVDQLIDEGKDKEALSAATSAGARFPKERQFKIQQARAQGHLGDLQAVDATMHSLLKNSSEDAQVYSILSSIQLEAGALQSAEENARKAAVMDPKDIGSLITLSIVQQREKKFKDSEASLRKALVIAPEDPTLLNNLGYYLTDRGERLSEAEDLIKRAVNIAPTNGSFLDSLGWLYFKEGKLQDAQKYLEQAVIYSPRSGTIHDHVGDLNKKLGNNDKAKVEWETALKLSTDQDELKKIKEKLSKLK